MRKRYEIDRNETILKDRDGVAFLRRKEVSLLTSLVKIIVSKAK